MTQNMAIDEGVAVRKVILGAALVLAAAVFIPCALMQPQVELTASDRKTVGKWPNESIAPLEREQVSAGEQRKYVDDD